MFSVSFGWRDVLASVCVVVLALVFLLLPLLWQEEGSVLVISTPDGTAEYELHTNRTLALSSAGIDLVIEIRNGVAHVESSTCSDGICVASGSLSHSGDTVICAPAGVRLFVKGGDGDVDFVAG